MWTRAALRRPYRNRRFAGVAATGIVIAAATAAINHVISLGGIASGVFTPTEASVIGR